MAEARSIANLGVDFTRNSASVELLYSEEQGVALTITIPPPRVVRANAVRRGYRLASTFRKLIYPLGIREVLIFLCCFTAFIYAMPETSWWRTGTPAFVISRICSWAPFYAYQPAPLRLVLKAVVGGLVVALFLATVQRYVLRALLSWHGWLNLEHGETSILVKLWGLAVKLICRGPHSLYSFQGTLPRMPVPSIAATVESYLKSVKPLQTEAEFTNTQRLAAAFLVQEGPRLQRYLIAKSWWAHNYVSDWWERFIYLRSRSPLMILSNYYGLDSYASCPTNCQVARAANAISQWMRFKKLLDREQLDPLMIRNIVPMCMDQYRRMFSTCRIPGRELDQLKHWDTGESRHIIVRCKERYYTLPLYYQGRLLTTCQIEDQLQQIKDAAAAAPAETEAAAHLPALTAINRTRWAEAREMFLSEGLNKRNLDEVESAMFHVVLDDHAPTEVSEKGRLAFHGTGWDRWYDKSVTLIVFANGMCGINTEHSWADALVIAHMWEWSQTGEMYESLGYNDKGRNVRTAEDLATPELPPLSRVLSWALPATAAETVRDAVTTAQAAIANVDLQILCHDSYGKGFIKKCRLSPDAYIQMAMQLAYYRDAGHFSLSYEACSMRLFRDGRTETVRPVSEDSCAFVLGMGNPALSNAQKIELFKQAVETHVVSFRDAMTGKGCDRHLFALYVVSIGRDIESPFLKAAISQPWTLSTSQQPQQQTTRWDPSKNPEDERRVSPGGGFGPVADDGYGVSYMIAGEKKIFFHISSFRASPHTDTARFARNLLQAFADIKALYEESVPEGRR